ncbi:hypothetical protein [Streptomyces sp. NPDC017890]|uniref:hypothetical protein n=1 Tax=Streptomyces sp. NPDC017890 TaxID=3365015 RepID=UPI0037A5D061
MPEPNESGQMLAGRLYATLRVLKFLAQPDSPKPSTWDEAEEKDRPRDRIEALRLDLFEDLVTAVQKGRNAQALSEVFCAIPALVPPKKAALNDNLGERALVDFNAGYRAQLTTLKKALPQLLD